MSHQGYRAVNGSPIRIDQSFAHLKPSQIERISEWLYLEYSQHRWEKGRSPGSNSDDTIIDTVYSRVEDEGIQISVEEVKKLYHSSKSRFQRRYKRESE